MQEENKPESNPTEMAGATRSAETARALIHKTKRATQRRFPSVPPRRHPSHDLLPWLKNFIEAGKGRMRGDGLHEPPATK